MFIDGWGSNDTYRTSRSPCLKSQFVGLETKHFESEGIWSWLLTLDVWKQNYCHLPINVRRFECRYDSGSWVARAEGGRVLYLLTSCRKKKTQVKLRLRLQRQSPWIIYEIACPKINNLVECWHRDRIRSSLHLGAPPLVPGSCSPLASSRKIQRRAALKLVQIAKRGRA